MCAVARPSSVVPRRSSRRASRVCHIAYVHEGAAKYTQVCIMHSHRAASEVHGGAVHRHRTSERPPAGLGPSTRARPHAAAAGSATQRERTPLARKPSNGACTAPCTYPTKNARPSAASLSTCERRSLPTMVSVLWPLYLLRMAAIAAFTTSDFWSALIGAYKPCLL